MKINEKDSLSIKRFSIELKKNILEMAFSAGASSSHLGGALSIVDIMSVLFSQKMKLNNDPKWGDRDRFILSKGHACLAYYAALCEKGYIEKKELQTFEKDDSNLLGHPVINKKLGIDFLTNLTKWPIWKQTSYNNNARKQYAGVGYTYDSSKNKFIAPQPFNSWSLNSNDDWQAPVTYPSTDEVGSNVLLIDWDEGNLRWTGKHDETNYIWDSSALSWSEV